jgi:hypothetical protein
VLAIGRGASRGTEGRDVEFGSFGPLDFAFDWLIPGFVVSVPGFLVMLIVVLQATVGTAWLPLVRRDLGEFGIRRRRPGGPRSGTKEAI